MRKKEAPTTAAKSQHTAGNPALMQGRGQVPTPAAQPYRTPSRNGHATNTRFDLPAAPTAAPAGHMQQTPANWPKQQPIAQRHQSFAVEGSQQLPALGQSPRLATMPQTPSKPTTAPTTTSSSEAEQLLVQAHQLSTSLGDDSGNEADFTQIVEACRRAVTSGASPEAAQYARELASWALNRRGQLKADAGRDQEALRDFEEAIRVDPKRWRAIHNRGVLLAQAGEFEKAFDDFHRTIQLNPEFPKAYSNRAALYLMAGNLSSALADYTRAIELDANLALAHRGCGRTYHLLGQLDKAIHHYDMAVRLAPEDAYAAASRADLLTDVGRYDEALAEYERAIKLEPQSSQALSGSAWLLATCPQDSLRNPKLAIERASKAIELNGEQDAASFDALAAAQACAGDFNAAIATMKQAIQLAPPAEQTIYHNRLALYQQAKPYRIAPLQQVQQASYEPEGNNQRASRK